MVLWNDTEYTILFSLSIEALSMGFQTSCTDIQYIGSSHHSRMCTCMILPVIIKTSGASPKMV